MLRYFGHVYPCPGPARPCFLRVPALGRAEPKEMSAAEADVVFTDFAFADPSVDYGYGEVSW